MKKNFFFHEYFRQDFHNFRMFSPTNFREKDFRDNVKTQTFFNPNSGVALHINLKVGPALQRLCHKAEHHTTVYVAEH